MHIQPEIAFIFFLDRNKLLIEWQYFDLLFLDSFDLVLLPVISC